MKIFEYKFLSANKLDFYGDTSCFEQKPWAKETVKELGAEGWEIIHIKDSVQHNNDVCIILKKETTLPQPENKCCGRCIKGLDTCIYDDQGDN